MIKLLVFMAFEPLVETAQKGEAPGFGPTRLGQVIGNKFQALRPSLAAYGDADASGSPLVGQEAGAIRQKDELAYALI